MSGAETMKAISAAVERMSKLPQAPKPDQTRDRSPFIQYSTGRLANPVAEADRIWARIQARKAKQQQFKEAAE